MEHWSDAVAKMNACSDAVAWLATQPDADTAWRECQRGDWMMWLLGKQGGEPGSDTRRPLVLAACECARLALPYVKAGKLHPLQAIETAERWARGGADAPSLDMVRKAAAAAAADVADDAAAYAAAYAAVGAAYVVVGDVAAAAAAYAAAYAAYAADDAYARSLTLARCADIVRKHYPNAPQLGAQRAERS